MSDDPFTFMSSLIDINPTIEHMFHHPTVVVPPSNLKEIDDKYPLQNDDVIKELYYSQVGKDGRNRRKMVRTKPHLKSIESFKTFQYEACVPTCTPGQQARLVSCRLPAPRHFHVVVWGSSTPGPFTA